MKKLITILIVYAFFAYSSKAQNAQQLVRIQSFSSQSLLDNITGTANEGMLAYRSDEDKLYFFNGSSWQQLANSSSSSGWGLNGNAGTSGNNNYIGTSDAADLEIATNGTTRLIVVDQASTDHRVLFPKVIFFPNSSSQYSAVLGINGTSGRLRITAGDDDTFDNSLGASVDLHGNDAENGFEGRLDLVAGSGASTTEQGINFYTGNTLRATFLGNDNVGVIAQEVEKILPNTVTITEEKGLKDMRTFDSSELIWTMINAIKELNQKIEILEEKIAESK